MRVGAEPNLQYLIFIFMNYYSDSSSELVSRSSPNLSEEIEVCE